ncbi:MAG: hypothetical protein HY875_01145 [Chloroflexi bacterium]|nr:hypothetical protein [Chloroflexota bacterium]
MSRPLVFGAALLVLAAFALYSPPLAAADSTVVSSTVDNGYPKSLTFKLEAKSDSDITDVSLSYSLSGKGGGAIGKPKELTPGKAVSVQVNVDTNTGNAYVPVGTELTYHWEITTADGKTTTTPDAKYFYLPPDHQWEKVSNDFMTVYYYGNRKPLAESYLAAGTDTYDRIGKQLLNVTLKQLPVNVVLFAVESELEKAKPGNGGTFDAAVVTCGTKVSSAVVLVIPQSCGTNDRTDTLRHEFGHILNQAAGEGPLGKLPSWLDEGAAVYAQSEPGDDYIGPFQSAARGNRLLPFSSMGVASSDASTVNIFYGQAYSMVKYLIDTGGAPRFAQFFANIKKGTRFDQALKDTYGYDMATFEANFLKAVGSTPRTNPTAAPTQRPQSAAATATPTTKPRAAAQSDGGDDGNDNLVALGIIGAAVLFALLAVMLYLVSQLLARNRTDAAAGAPPKEPPDSDGPPL